MATDGTKLPEIVSRQRSMTDFASAVVWYEELLEGPPDSRPMDGLAEWEFPSGGGLQIFPDQDRAGSSSVTLTVPSIDEQLADLENLGITVQGTNVSEITKIAVVPDPDGNTIVFAEALSKTVTS